MVHEMIDGTYRQTNLLNESPEYLVKREELRLAEIELNFFFLTISSFLPYPQLI